MTILLVLIGAYLIGSLPPGFWIVKLITGRDIRKIESGRTGGTNAMRAAGPFAGLATALLDVLKGVGAGWLAQWILPGDYWVHVLAPVMAIIGHNASIFLIERNSKGQIQLRGGAGGATCLGGVISLWPMSGLIILPVAALIFVFVGYASVTTMSVGILALLMMVFRAWSGVSPWVYVLYGLMAEVVILWALRPNITRLIKGTERLVGLRAYLIKKANLKKAHQKYYFQRKLDKV